MIKSTHVAAITGVDPYRNSDDVMRELVRAHHGLQPEFMGNIATQWGVIHEEEALADFQWSLGVEVVRASACVHPKYEWLSAHPFGFLGDDAIVLIRCPFGIRADEFPLFMSAKEQPQYYARMQIEMYVTERHLCHFWQWTPFGRKHETIEYDGAFVAQTFPALKAFHQTYLAELTSPEEYLEEKRVVIDTPRASQMVAEYDDLIEAIDRATERKKELVQAMVEMSKGKNAIFGGRKLTKTKKAGAISYAQAIKHLAPGANLEPWRGKPSESWGLK